MSVVGLRSYPAVHRQRSGLSYCCCPYLEQSAPTCHSTLHILYVCFPRSPQGFPLQAFLPNGMTGLSQHFVGYCLCSDTVVIFGHFKSFCFTLLCLCLCSYVTSCLSVLYWLCIDLDLGFDTMFYVPRYNATQMSLP